MHGVKEPSGRMEKALCITVVYISGMGLCYAVPSGQLTYLTGTVSTFVKYLICPGNTLHQGPIALTYTVVPPISV